MIAKFLDVVRTDQVLLGDGAMGTQLQAAGLMPGECGDLWNLKCPDRVLDVHRSYVIAGSDCITTNSFGACRIALGRHGQEGLVEQINRAAVQIARQSFADGNGYVLGDIGPFGGLMEPYGELSRQEVYSSFLEQAKALVAAGADAVIIETQTSLEELGAAIEAAQEAGAPCIIASMSFDLVKGGTDLKTMMGVGPEQAAEFMQELGVDVAGTNCGTNVDLVWAAEILKRYRKACDLPLMAQPNCGKPTLEDGRIVYKEDAGDFGSAVRALLDAGGSVIGACCGSTPAHIRAMRTEINALAKG